MVISERVCACVGTVRLDGRIAGGAVIKDPAGRVLRMAARLYAPDSDCAAAYGAAEHALRLALGLRIRQMDLACSDPRVVAQLTGLEPVPADLIGAYLQIRAMMNAYWSVRVRWVDPELNGDAIHIASRLLQMPGRRSVESLPLWLPQAVSA